MSDAPKVGKTIWKQNKSDIFDRLNRITSDAETVRNAPSAAKSKAVDIAMSAAAITTAFVQMVDIAEKEIEKLRQNGNE